MFTRTKLKGLLHYLSLSNKIFLYAKGSSVWYLRHNSFFREWWVKLFETNFCWFIVLRVVNSKDKFWHYRIITMYSRYSRLMVIIQKLPIQYVILMLVHFGSDKAEDVSVYKKWLRLLYSSLLWLGCIVHTISLILHFFFFLWPSV